MDPKKIILVDMDGVLVKEPTRESLPHDYDEHKIHWSDIPDIFLNLEPMEGAIDAFNKLSQYFDVHIVSTAPWANPSAWTDKRKWVEKHLPGGKKKLTLTHNKNMVRGDFLVDDRLKNGVDRFSGLVIQFGQAPFENWDKVMEFFMEIVYGDAIVTLEMQ